MGFDGGFGNGQIKGDLLVQLALADQLQNPCLLTGQQRQPCDGGIPRFGLMRMFAGGDIAFGHKLLACAHRVKRRAKHFAPGMFGHKPRCPRLQARTNHPVVRQR